MLRLSAKPTSYREMTTMIGMLLFFAVIALMGAFGWTADSRDSADWKPTNHGTRAPRWE
jgi:hypothetical protein